MIGTSVRAERGPDDVVVTLLPHAGCAGTRSARTFLIGTTGFFEPPPLCGYVGALCGYARTVMCGATRRARRSFMPAGFVVVADAVVVAPCFLAPFWSGARKWDCG